MNIGLLVWSLKTQALDKNLKIKMLVWSWTRDEIDFEIWPLRGPRDQT
jgi:hypothetical protein